METLELPVVETPEEGTPPQATFTDQEIDLAAFRLWQEASIPEVGSERTPGEEPA